MKIQRKIKRHMKSTLATAVLAAMLITTPVFALPQNPTVTVGSGQITIDNGAGGILNIGVGANGVIDWSSFSIASGETVNFNFADTLAVLNRVNGSSMSELSGALNSTGANGSIFLVNPNGVLVGQGAQINASNLVLSTLDVSNDNFMQLVGSWKSDSNHPLTFTKGSQQDVAGAIEIKSGATFKPMGYLGLVGGSITIAPNVTIETSMDSSFVAADKATINFMQHSNGAIEHYDTDSFNSQAANSISIAGNIKSDSINISGHNISFDQANLTTNWLDVVAGNKLEQNNGNILDASADNKITLTDSTITLTDGYSDEAYAVKMAGGQVAMNNSSITIDDQISPDTPKVIIAAANKMQWQDAGIHITDANPNNTIALNNVSISNPNSQDAAGIFVLGGKVDISGSSIIKGGEVFIGAGSQLGLEAAYDEDNDQYWDEYYFANSFKSGFGNTVNLGKDTVLVANGESGILGNAVTNAGTINSHGHYGFNISAFDERSFNDKTNKGYIISSQNNKVINTGKIYADQANFDPGAEREYSVIGISAGIIDNTGGIIQASRHPDAATNPNHWPGSNSTEGAADLLAIGTVQGVDPTDKSIKVVEQKLDLNTNNYKLWVNDDGDILSVDKLPLNGDPTGPTNPTIDEILTGDGSLEKKQEQIIEVVNTINTLPVKEQNSAVVSAISSIQGQTSLSKSEKESLLGSVVNAYEGTAATKTESNNQITANNTSNTNNTDDTATVAFSANESESNIVMD